MLKEDKGRTHAPTIHVFPIMMLEQMDSPRNGAAKSFTQAQLFQSFDTRLKLKKSHTSLSETKISRSDRISAAGENESCGEIVASPPVRQKGVDLSKLLSGSQNKKEHTPVNRSKKSLFVTLKVPERRSLMVTLKVKKKGMDSAISKQKVNAGGSSHPFFKEVYQRMKTKTDIESKNGNNTETDSGGQKQRKLEGGRSVSEMRLPVVQRQYFKVLNLSAEEAPFYKKILESTLSTSFQKKVSCDTIMEDSFTGMDFLLFYTSYKDTLSAKPSFEYAVTTDNTPDLFLHSLLNRYQHIQFDDRFNKFFDKTYCDSHKADKTTQWCDLYHPQSYSQNLQKEYISSDVSNWVSMAFTKLKKVNQNKRREKLGKKGSSTTKDKYLDSFIVYTDDEDSDAGTEDYSSHVPSLIIEGPIGCGKTSMIHSIVDYELNGYVFEFNSSQSRARKDLEFHLKQIGTTSMVKNSNYNHDKTVILFDDVDLIEENNGDKDFWLGVTELLSYSYRPVIFITSDIQKVPNNIVDASTVYRFDKIQQHELYQYLDMVALSRGINVDSKILDKFSLLDLRKSLMQLQLFTYHFNIANVGLTNITILDANGPLLTNGETKSTSNLKTLRNLSLQNDLDFFGGKINSMDEYYIAPADDTNIDAEEAFLNLNNHFQKERNSCLEFYASKYFSNGSRSKMCRYSDGEHYNKKHPGNCFLELPRDKMSTDVLAMVYEMAKKENTRVLNNNPRRFELFPIDIFDDIDL